MALTGGSSGTIRFAVHVQPRASRSEVLGRHGDALKVRLQAPPVDGAANDALVELLASALGVPRREIRLVAGQTARRKVVEVPEAAQSRVMALASG
ncbi:MAG: DUF167 domain-containing protein [Gemmatimonadetes bacterium]|nr:DUF167 domain-containing protein [Gemmatimonadota bacterium]